MLSATELKSFPVKQAFGARRKILKYLNNKLIVIHLFNNSFFSLKISQ